MGRWNSNSFLLTAGILDIVIAGLINIALVPSFAAQASPLFAGAVIGGILLYFVRKPWAYLVAGILTALFPLVVIFVFGASGALTHPGGGVEALSIALVLLGAILALLGGILGFVQGRRDAHPPAEGWVRTRQGLVALLLVGIFVGWAIANAYATGAARDAAERPVHFAESVDERIRIVTTGIAFAPKAVTIPAGKLVALDIENEDPVLHTFSYHLTDGVHETAILPHTKMTILVKFDTPQTIHVWCAPHSTGVDDTSDEGMWMDMTVA